MSISRTARYIWRVELLGARLLAQVDIAAGIPENALSWSDRRMVSWVGDDSLCSVQFGQSRPRHAAIPLPVFGSKVECIDVLPDFSRAVLATSTEIVEVDADGTVRWRTDFPRRGPAPWWSYPACVYGADGRDVWLYRPDVAADRAEEDKVFLLDAADGSILAERAIPTAGHGARMLRHPDGSVLFDVGEGQDGVAVYRGRRDGGELTVHDYGWADRCLLSVSPSGGSFMTVDHGQSDVGFHSYPDGETITTVTAADLAEEDPEDVYADWIGGYLDADTAVVTVTDGESDATRFLMLDVTTASVVGTLAERPYLLGDGTWVTRDELGILSQWGLNRPLGNPRL
ncbi:hypothetical protein STSO111631_00170 [Stackebrandtia soli]